MNEVMEKTSILLEKLENSETIKNIKRVKNEALKNPHLLSLLKEYEETQAENIKEEILKNPLFKEYKEEEIELNLFIMSMNQELKKIKGKGDCSHENH